MQHLEHVFNLKKGYFTLLVDSTAPVLVLK